MIEKKIVYLPNKSCEIIDNTIVLPNGTKFQGTEGYFFTQEQLNEYTQSVIKESVDNCLAHPRSKINAFDEIYEKLKL